MKSGRIRLCVLIVCAGFLCGGCGTGMEPGDDTTDDSATEGPMSSGVDMFVKFAGKSPAEVEGKVDEAFERFFGIGTGENAVPIRDEGYRCYYELPQDDSMAFIWAADSNDIRSEGMSYGMMLAVQYGLRDRFDKLWKFAKTHMQYPPDSPYVSWRHFFRWQLTALDTSNGSEWTWTVGADTTPASDGEEYIAMALYLADRRWGSGGTFDYKAEADAVTDAMLNNPSSEGKFPIIHRTRTMVSFCPVGSAYDYTDPSYHVPAFYECFALWGPRENESRWMVVAEASRDFLVASAHDETGLHPDYATYDGAPTTQSFGAAGSPGGGLSGTDHDTFRYDAWRVVMNMAMDFVWIGSDVRMRNAVEAYHSFFAGHKGTSSVANSLFTLDGSSASGGGSTALVATLAAGAMVSSHPDASFWVEALWNVPQQWGTYRYYQQCVYLLGLLNVSGRYRTSW